MRFRFLVRVLLVSMSAAAMAHAEALRWQPAQPAARPAQPAAQPSTGDKPAFKQEELDQMVAPLALYPDSLISQIFMAATYPLDIVQADRWVKANKSLKGDALAQALEAQKWDPSVKSLVNFPDVLAMLSEKLDWTTKLGDAFIGQQKELMGAVQRLRGKAKEAGNLKSTKEQNVEVKQEGDTQVIVIESANPDVIYVPTYDSTVVYGGWPYPAYPPYPYYPPGYYYPYGGAVLAFGVGVACGLAWGYAWGGCNWGHGDVNINVDRNRNRNNNINRDNFRDRNGQNFRHDGSRRGNVPYRNSAEANRFGGRSAGQAAQARESFRGRGGMEGASRSNPGVANRGGAGTGGNRGTAQRPSTRPSGGTAQRPTSRPSGGAFNGANGGGRQTAAASQRGSSSRGSAGGSRGGGSRGGGARGGGGRGGGGRGGGRR